MASKYKVLVVGSNGFIGKNIVEYLEEQNYNVLCPKRNNLDLLDTEKVFDFIQSHIPDVVIHCAVNINSLIDNLRIYYNLERCSASFGRMITIGSGAEYDMKNYKPLMHESFFSNHIPSDVYGLAIIEGLSLFLLSPFTIPMKTQAIGKEAERLIKVLVQW